jgi:hypothetical protein
MCSQGNMIISSCQVFVNLASISHMIISSDISQPVAFDHWYTFSRPLTKVRGIENLSQASDVCHFDVLW